MVSGGMIDTDCRGQIRVLLHNSTRKSKKVQKSECIAQGLFLKSPQVELVKSNQLSDTTRGDHGFGSTESCRKKDYLSLLLVILTSIPLTTSYSITYFDCDHITN